MDNKKFNITKKNTFKSIAFLPKSWKLLIPKKFSIRTDEYATNSIAY